MFTRLLGAKQIGQLTFFHYVVGISIGSIAGTTSVSGQVSAFEGVASIAVWSLMAVITTWISLKSRAIRGWLEGRPVVVIKNGQIMEENLTHARMNLDDLSALLRSKEYHGLSTKLVIDGRIQTDNLKLVHLSEAWLCQQLAQRGITDLSEVIYAELDTSGKLYVDRRQDSPEFGKGPEG